MARAGWYSIELETAWKAVKESCLEVGKDAPRISQGGPIMSKFRKLPHIIVERTLPSGESLITQPQVLTKCFVSGLVSRCDIK